jgi:hemolysin activation/secretion protein
LKKKLLPIALLALGHVAFAQQPPPGAGGQLLQIPPAPVAPKAAPEFRIEQRAEPAAPAAAADQVKVIVNSLRITGASAFSESDLLAQTGFTPGSELTLVDLEAMAAKISRHYHRNGYFVARAYLPAQEIKDNAVTIAVSEGQYGNITLRNTSNLSDSLARSRMEGLSSGDTITELPLESRLLLLSDIPGVQVTSTLAPGASVGTSDLIIDLAPGRRVSGSVDADNAGNPYTGANRIGATIDINNPLGLGDVAELRVLTSGEGLKYARASYQLQVGKGQVGVAYSWLDYSLGKQFESLHAHGTAEIASVFGRYPLIRSRDNNLYAQLAYDHKIFEDKVDATGSVINRKSDVLMASVYGDHRDQLGGGGFSSYGLTLSAGKLDIQTPAALALDAATAQTNGNFNKLSFNAARLQNLGGPFSIYGAINGQMASRNLDISEQMELGGMNAVRAYPEGEGFADEGYVATLEARMQLPKFSALPGHLELVGFVDTGTVTLHRNPWFAGDNRRTLSGAGVGLNWGEAGNFLVRTSYAWKLGNEKALSSPDKSGRFWIQAIKYF